MRVLKNSFNRPLLNVGKVFPPPSFYLFQTGNRNFLFHRDTLSTVKLPNKLNNSHVKKIKNLFKEAKVSTKNISRPFLRTMALNLTNNCNFVCRYCFANHGNYGKPGLVMRDEIAIKAIDLLFSSVKRNKQERAAIAFFGGEPLLEWDLIKKIVLYAKANKPQKINLRFLLTTNASLLTKEKIRFMRENDFSLMVSIDGPQENHDRNRIKSNGGGTYDLVIKNILSANRVIPLTFRATITNNNLDLVKIVNHFKKLGARMITFGLDNDNLKKENYRKIMRSYEKLSNLYYNDLIQEQFYEITNFTQIFFQILFKERKVSHCNAGLSYLGVAADGKVYKCPRFTDIPGHQFASIQNMMGVQRKLKAFRSKLRRDARYRNSNCAKCPFVFLCGGLCHYDLFQKDKTVYGLIPEQCELRRKIYHETIKLYARLPQKVKRNFFHKLTDLPMKGGEDYD